MANEVIGHVKCAWCGSAKASVSVSKAQLCCVTCRACHAQTFARGAYSDAMIRQAMKPVERPAPAPAMAMPEPAPGMEIAPKPARKLESKPAPSTPAASGEGKGDKGPKASEPAPKKRGAWDLW